MGARGSFGRCSLEAKVRERGRQGGRKPIGGMLRSRLPGWTPGAPSSWGPLGDGATWVTHPRVKVAVFTLHFHPMLAEGGSWGHSLQPAPGARPAQALAQPEDCRTSGEQGADCRDMGAGTAASAPTEQASARTVHAQEGRRAGNSRSKSSPHGVSVSTKLCCSICPPWRLAVPLSQMTEGCVRR